mmetsp:Transcript_72778/g.200851  ORF Transcript_72778/g.200851 Transcript_72778/m.200851 type:complete len:221 (+) Transcript_72778:612-1274(+)
MHPTLPAAGQLAHQTVTSPSQPRLVVAQRAVLGPLDTDEIRGQERIDALAARPDLLHGFVEGGKGRRPDAPDVVVQEHDVHTLGRGQSLDLQAIGRVEDPEGLSLCGAARATHPRRRGAKHIVVPDVHACGQRRPLRRFGAPRGRRWLQPPLCQDGCMFLTHPRRNCGLATRLLPQFAGLASADSRLAGCQSQPAEPQKIEYTYSDHDVCELAVCWKRIL